MEDKRTNYNQSFYPTGDRPPSPDPDADHDADRRPDPRVSHPHSHTCL